MMIKKYDIIYADPPWKGAGQNVSPKSMINYENSFHYNAMTLDDICALPVNNLSKDDALLFLWVRSPMLDSGIIVGSTWGFKYSTIGFVWDKQRILPSFYTPSQVEICLIFKKGRIPKPIGSTKEHQFLSEKRREHSRKPDTIRDRITNMFPTQDKIELFARQKFYGWDNWGNEIECSIDMNDYYLGEN